MFWTGFNGVAAAVLQHIFTLSSWSGCLAGAVCIISRACLLGKAKNRSHCVFLLQNQGEYLRVNSWADLLKIATHVNMNQRSVYKHAAPKGIKTSSGLVGISCSH